MTPEQKARVNIDALLQQAGWHVCHMNDANIHAARGVALREFPLNPGYGFADYLLYIDGKAAGVIEAKKEGSTLTGVEVQSARYAQGLGLVQCHHQQPHEETLRLGFFNQRQFGCMREHGFTDSSSHLHMALSTATGEIFGGHVAPVCIVCTSAEVLLALLPEWEFSREPDATTGYDELVVRVVSE